MNLGKTLVKGASAIVLLSSFVSIAASADELNQTGVNFNATKHVSANLPGVPAYFDETLNAPSKMAIAKSKKNGEPDFDNMSEATPVRIGCGISVVDQLASTVLGGGTTILGSLWAGALAVACFKSWRADRVFSRSKLFKALAVALSAWFAPFILLPIMLLRVIYLIGKFTVLKTISLVRFIVRSFRDDQESVSEQYKLDNSAQAVSGKEIVKTRSCPSEFDKQLVSEQFANKSVTAIPVDNKSVDNKSVANETVANKPVAKIPVANEIDANENVVNESAANRTVPTNSAYVSVLERCLKNSGYDVADTNKEEKELCQLK